MNTPGQRLAEVRAKIYPSARAAAINLNVPVSTYNAHERSGEPGGRKFSPEEAERYARAFRTSPSWLLFGKESDPVAVEPNRSPSLAAPMPVAPNASAPFALPAMPRGRIPIYGRAVGGDEGKFIFNGERMGDVFCPPMLEEVSDAYALEIYGESMMPRLRPGETVWVNPRRPVHKGDDVIVQMHPTEEGGDVEGYVKEFVSLTPTRLILKQHNPEMEIEIDRSAVISVHKVVFSARI